MGACALCGTGEAMAALRVAAGRVCSDAALACGGLADAVGAVVGAHGLAQPEVAGTVRLFSEPAGVFVYAPGCGVKVGLLFAKALPPPRWRCPVQATPDAGAGLASAKQRLPECNSGAAGRAGCYCHCMNLKKPKLILERRIEDADYKIRIGADRVITQCRAKEKVEIPA